MLQSKEAMLIYCCRHLDIFAYKLKSISQRLSCDTFNSIVVPTFHTESMIETEKLCKFFMEILPVAIKKKAFHHTLFLFNLLTNLICKMSGSLHAILYITCWLRERCFGE